MSDIANNAGWWSVINHRVREREVRRQLLYSNARNTVVRHSYFAQYVAHRVPPIVGEFLKMMGGSLIGLWIIAKLLAFVFHASPLYTFLVFGLIYSVQATYYKYRLSVDPGYKIPKCRCAGQRNDHSEVVLKSKQSTIMKVPYSVLGGVFYFVLLVLAYLKHADVVMPAAVGAIGMSAYLSYAMIVKIGSLCVKCINVSALNILILFQVLTFTLF